MNYTISNAPFWTRCNLDRFYLNNLAFLLSWRICGSSARLGWGRSLDTRVEQSIKFREDGWRKNRRRRGSICEKKQWAEIISINIDLLSLRRRRIRHNRFNKRANIDWPKEHNLEKSESKNEKLTHPTFSWWTDSSEILTQIRPWEYEGGSRRKAMRTGIL